MMKRLTFLLLTAFSMMAGLAMAQTPGSSCTNPIPVDSTYSAIIPSPGTYWYSAWTHDLPVAVNFAPTAGANVTMPEVEVDFTCTPGVYDDSIMTELFSPNNTSGTYIAMPQRLSYDYIAAEGVYHLSIGTSYRDMMGMMGLTDDVQAYVKVTFPSAGNIYMVPDTLYRDCENNSQRVALGDSLLITPNDSDRVYILPYSEWKNDSIRYVWKAGNNSHPLTVWIAGTDCHFNMTTADPNVWDYYEIEADGTYKLTAAEVQSTVQDFNDAGGIFYARIQTAGAGYLIVEKVPEREVDPSAKLLKYNTPVALTVADSSKFFYITKSAWKKATSFATTSQIPFQMVFSSSMTMSASTADPNVLAVYTSSRNYPGHAVSLTDAQMTALWNATQDKFIYVRFIPTASETITATRWATSECVDHTTLLPLGTAFSVASGETTVFRLRYDDIERGSLLFKWSGNSTCPTYVADTCSPAEWNYNAPEIIQYKSISRKGSWSVDSTTVASWKARVDADGYIYLRFKPNNTGNLTVTLTRVELPDPEEEPEEDPKEDPEPTPTPEMGSLRLECPTDNSIQISVTEDQWLVLTDQYGHELAAWMQHVTDAPRTFTIICGVEYRLRGKANTVRILR